MRIWWCIGKWWLMTCTIHWLLICSYGGFPFGIVRCNMLDQLITNSLKLKWYKSLILPLFLRWTFAKIMRFFGTKKTNEKTLIKKAISGANFSFFDAENVLYYFWLVINWYLIYYVFMKCFRGTNWGQKFAVQKIKRANIRSIPWCFLGQFFCPSERKTIPFSSYDDIRSTLQI